MHGMQLTDNTCLQFWAFSTEPSFEELTLVSQEPAAQFLSAAVRQAESKV